ncbi:MAG TPA: PAS domain S-box protein [Chthonomonadaceae bacterium]|nr:PAS domain S-box protein [Chthonomonadaceae bacterium]
MGKRSAPAKGEPGSTPEPAGPQQRESWLWMALEAAHIGIWERNIQTGQITWSENLEAVLGMSPGAFGGTFEGFLRILHPEDRDRVRQEIEKAVQDRADYSIEFRVLPPEGSSRWIAAYGKVFSDNAGKAVRVVGVLMDITERGKAAETQQRLAAIVESSEDAILATDLNGIVTDWNRGAERLYGYTAEEMIGRSKTLVISPDMANELPSILERIRHGERIERYETARRCKDGTRIDILISVSPVRDANGQIIGASTIARDITQRKREEAAQRFLAEASALLASSLDYETTLINIAHLAVPHLADWCIVHVVQEDGTVRQLTIAHSIPEKLKWAEELQRRYPPDPEVPRGVYNVLRTGRSELYPEISDELLVLTAEDEEHLRILREVGFTSVIIAPMKARGRTLGAITFIAAESGRHYTTADLAIAEDLAHKAALAVDNARLYQAAQQQNRKLQILSQASQKINAVLEVPVIMRALIDASLELVEAQVGAWALVENGRMVFREYIAEGQSRPLDYAFEPGIGVPGWVLATKSPYIANDAAHDAHVLPHLQRQYGYYNVIAVPLFDGKGSLLGCFALHNKAGRQPFDQNDLALLQGLAASAGIALGNALMLRERQEHLQEIAALNERLRRAMRETHHRVRNSLQLIAALADMPAPEGMEMVPVEELRRLGSQVRALAAVHGILTQQASEGGEANYVSAHEILSQLMELLRQTAPGAHIQADIEEFRLSARQASSLAIVVNELITNALKYGQGEVQIRFHIVADRAVLEVMDNGPGFSEDFDPRIAQNTGLALVDHIARWDLNAEVCFGNRPGGGGQVMVTMPAITESIPA